MDYGRPPAEHFALGRQLNSLGNAVLVVGSGNIVHNLRALRREASAGQAYPWAIEFHARTAALLEQGALAGWRSSRAGGGGALAHPTYEHYLPLLYAAGAGSRRGRCFFNDRFQAASIAMRLGGLG